MQEKEILTSQEKQQLNEYCADEIYQYGRNYMKLIKVFESYGYRMPVECWHNFRDSWFHYRKLYTRKERISILNEKYAMEEQLLRAWKDAIIFFFTGNFMRLGILVCQRSGFSWSGGIHG